MESSLPELASKDGTVPDSATSSAPTVPTDRFMSVAIHDLRNPVAVMRASAQMALRHLSRGEVDGVHRRIDAIITQADRVNDLMERFLDAARLQAGTLVLRREMVSLAVLARESAERAKSRSPERGDRELSLDLGEDCVGEWDPSRLGRAITALVENAFNYGAPDEPVQVRIQANATWVVICVSGGGPGPREEEVDRLFLPFFRGGAAAESGAAGSGLGLFVARGIARAHGGDVDWVGGTAPDTFELKLPLAA